METNKETNNTQQNNPKPDKETLRTTDPEKNMEGPVSSATRKTGEAFDSGESKESADEKRDRAMSGN